LVILRELLQVTHHPTLSTPLASGLVNNEFRVPVCENYLRHLHLVSPICLNDSYLEVFEAWTYGVKGKHLQPSLELQPQGGVRSELSPIF
jgi:hypothetical protein